MYHVDAYEELENEHLRRFEEYTKIKNILYKDNTHIEYVNKYLIVILQAFVEGYVKIAFEIYIKYVNLNRINVNCINRYLLTLTLSKELTTLCDTNKKSKLFKRKLPEDKKLHLLARQYNFINEYENIQNHTVEIRSEDVTGFNLLFPNSIKRALFLLGLDYDWIDEYKCILYKIINKRNDIAHEMMGDEVEANEYNDLESNIFKIMEEIKLLIYLSLKNERYIDDS
ncbi:MAG: hypothetical protein GF399_06235 [Candidatus Coatesbacteria bacterium]|nr:hypothetical protein [Candidatus Coatesbacteria bacterium]